jgi:hypothetical protein
MRLESNYILFLFQSKTSSSLLPGVSKVINNSKNEGQTGNREQGREYKNKEEEEKGCQLCWCTFSIQTENTTRSLLRASSCFSRALTATTKQHLPTKNRNI